MSRCTCDRVEYVVDGELVTGVVRIDPDCGTHGLPEKCEPWQWPPGVAHLRRHARPGEGPRDVEARLLREANE